jgi:hypothetical protein
MPSPGRRARGFDREFAGIIGRLSCLRRFRFAKWLAGPHPRTSLPAAGPFASRDQHFSSVTGIRTAQTFPRAALATRPARPDPLNSRAKSHRTEVRADAGTPAAAINAAANVRPIARAPRAVDRKSGPICMSHCLTPPVQRFDRTAAGFESAPIRRLFAGGTPNPGALVELQLSQMKVMEWPERERRALAIGMSPRGKAVAIVRHAAEIAPREASARTPRDGLLGSLAMPQMRRACARCRLPPPLATPLWCWAHFWCRISAHELSGAGG